MALNKRSNEYADALEGTLIEKCPKTVFAAIAVSALTCGGDHIEQADSAVIREWWTLYDNGIVPQRPPFPRPEDTA